MVVTAKCWNGDLMMIQMIQMMRLIQIQRTFSPDLSLVVTGAAVVEEQVDVDHHHGRALQLPLLALRPPGPGEQLVSDEGDQVVEECGQETQH